MYSFGVSAILVSMIVTGAARSIAVKLFYQMGFSQPMFVTLLYLLGQSLALVVYFVTSRIEQKVDREYAQQQQGPACKTLEEPSDDDYVEMMEATAPASVVTEEGGTTAWSTILVSVIDGTSGQGRGDDTDELSSIPNAILADYVEDAMIPPPPDLNRRGSASGLTEESKRAVSWIHRIPRNYRPAIPGFFNLCNSAMRWASLIYIPASVAEMLISGLELVLSVVAARFIRKRMISKARWKGVGTVTVGVVMVGVVHVMSDTSADDENDNGKAIGLLLIIGQCIMSVCQDMAEELFMQETQMPATMLLGFEGLFGLAFGIILYFPVAPLLGEDPSETREKLGDPGMAKFALGLVTLVLVTAIFNILATAVTSSMTRNVWKNLRTALVWIFALGIYRITSDDALGEPWVSPTSYFILASFGVIVTGIVVYYSNK